MENDTEGITAGRYSGAPLQPFLKWAGGKRQLLPEIRKRLPGDMGRYTYYEPFAGAGAVFLALRPGRAVINDCNGQLILTYRVIKKDVEGLISLLKKHQEMNGEDYYYAVRNLDRDAAEFDALTDTEKAARLIFLNKTCYNGLYRVNSQGHFNVPRGRYKNPAICEETLLRQIHRYFAANEIRVLNGDFEDAVSGAGRDSFVYFDPPYHSRSGFTAYQAGGFGEEEQRRLRDVIVTLTARGAKCLLSNADTGYIRELYDYGFFNRETIPAKRAINSNPSGRGAVNEVLIRNWRD